MIGKEILNYTIVSFIGKGGMGSVYLAEHKYIKQQKVAIKVINTEMVNAFTRKHLEEEAEHLASLNHQNIVHFLDYHIDEEGNIYLIMEYADGVSLDEYIRTISGLIVEDRICPLFEPILDAVGYAHKHKIIHLDIKPANIIITHEGIPKILDFGIAKIIDKGENGGDSSEGLIMGTPSYMSPEQVKGEELDSRSDIYSLGVLLHQMMTGNAPYDTTTLTEYDINKKVVEEPLPRMRTYYKYVSDKVQAIVDKATAKRKEDRYQTCEEFKKALHTAIYPPKIPRWVKLSAVATVLLVICGGVYWWDYTRVKIYYYKDYVEQWGVPQGIHKLSAKEQAQRTESYEFVYCRRQLQRMSYVNSKKHLTTHHTTDDIDRPTDMKLFYQANGDLDYVKVLDQSGKVLYVKDYSPDLKVAIFKYDDEYGTEKNLTANSVTTFTSTMNDAENSRSKISRYLITYDDKGHIVQLKYATYQNVLVCDNEGIYGKKFKLDEKGRVVEETFIGKDGNPKATKSGMAIRTREYNAEDDGIRFTYLSVDREPSGETELEVPVCHNMVDKWGNIIRQQYEDMNGNLVLRKDANVAAFEYEIKDGLILKINSLDVDGNRCYNKGNRISGVIYEYDEYGYSSVIKYVDINNKPMACQDGTFGCIAKNDASGNTLWQASVDADGNYMNTSSGFSIVKAKYDDKGNILELSWYDKNDSLTNQNNGIAIQQCEYDEQNRIIKYRNFDKNRQPAQDNLAVYCGEYIYSRQGNLVQVAYYDAEGKNLALSIEGIAGWKSEFDDWGNEVKRQFFDTETKVTVLKDGYAGWNASYDERGNQLDFYYFDEKGEICATRQGYAGIKYEYDERGNMLSSMEYGVDHKLASGRLFAKYKYDENDNQIEFAVFDKSGKPALNADNYHKKVSAYNNRKQLVSDEFLGTDGKPIAYQKGNYAMVKYVYDAKGDNVETSFFGVNGRPVCKSKEEQYATHKSEFDNMGRIVHQRFYDEKGNPTLPSKMIPEGFCQYDKWGNQCYLASADGNGKLIQNPSTGWCIRRQEYNAMGYLLSESYYDEKDKPIKIKNGYHKIESKYNAKGNLLERAYLDTESNLVLSTERYAKEIYTYDETERWTSIAYYGTKEEAVNSSNQYHRMDLVYDEEGNLHTRKYYDKNGSLLLTEKWNGLQWVVQQQATPTTSQPSNWKAQIASLSSELPLDLGENANHLIVSTAKVVGNNTCELTFKAPKSKYEMSVEELQEYISNVKTLINSFYSEKILPSNVPLKVILYDNKSRILYKN